MKTHLVISGQMFVRRLAEVYACLNNSSGYSSPNAIPYDLLSALPVRVRWITTTGNQMSSYDKKP